MTPQYVHGSRVPCHVLPTAEPERWSQETVGDGDGTATARRCVGGW